MEGLIEKLSKGSRSATDTYNLYLFCIPYLVVGVSWECRGSVVGVSWECRGSVHELYWLSIGFCPALLSVALLSPVGCLSSKDPSRSTLVYHISCVHVLVSSEWVLMQTPCSYYSAQQILIPRSLILSLNLGKSPYSSAFVIRCSQWTLRTVLSMHGAIQLLSKFGCISPGFTPLEND